VRSQSRATLGSSANAKKPGSAPPNRKWDLKYDLTQGALAKPRDPGLWDETPSG
jgi:hypothetical protein